MNFKSENIFSAIVKNDSILEDKNARLSVQLFVKEDKIIEESFDLLLNDWEQSSTSLKKTMNQLFKTLANG